MLDEIKAFAEENSLALLIAGSDRRLTYASELFRQNLPDPSEKIIGRKIDDFIFGDLPVKQQQVIWKKVVAGNIWKGEVCQRQGNGRVRWQAVTLSPKQASDAASIVVATLLDVTDRRRAEEMARRSQQMLDSLSQSLLQFLHTGNIKNVGESLIERCVQISRANFGFLVHLDDHGELKILARSENLPKSISINKFLEAESAYIDKDGFCIIPKSEHWIFSPLREKRTLNCSASDLRANCDLEACPLKSFLGVPLKIGEQVVGMIALLNREGGFGEQQISDVEIFAQTAALIIQNAQAEVARERAVQHLGGVQKYEAIGKLAGGIAHDFNNLLTVINGYSQLLLDVLKEGDNSRRAAEAIFDAGEHASNLTRQLLAFSRQQVLAPAVLDINCLIRKQEKIIRRLIREDIHIDLSLDENLGRIKADPGQIEQILLNLLVNARDSIPGNGMISISTANSRFDNRFIKTHEGAVRGNYVMFAITDTGAGMPEEVKDRIFEPFYTTKEQGRGTGLGLATVYGIVKQSGGYIYVDSTPGKGSSFKVYLPCVDEKTASKPEADSSDLPNGKGTLLVVEDEERVLTLVSSVLEGGGYKVLKVSNPHDAIQLFQQNDGNIDLILTDVIMPGMSGPELIDILKKNYSNIKVIFMSGYPAFKGENELREDKDIGFLSKPFTRDILLKKVLEFIDY